MRREVAHHFDTQPPAGKRKATQKGVPMDKFIPYEKLSKKKQRELNAARRGTWVLNPVTRKPANPKAYNRKAARNWEDDSNSVLLSFDKI
jgi:hypothetical protein